MKNNFSSLQNIGTFFEVIFTKKNIFKNFSFKYKNLYTIFYKYFGEHNNNFNNKQNFPR